MRTDQNKSERDSNAAPVEDGSKRERWFDLGKLVLGFVLTGVVGTGVSQIYKEREIRNDQHRKEVEADRQLYCDLVESFSKRHFYALQADVAAEAWNNKGDPKWRYEEGRARMDEAFGTYHESIKEWNLQRFRMVAILQTHVGKDCRDKLDKIIPILDQTEDDLQKLRDAAIYEDRFDQDLHDNILTQIENGEEEAIQGFFDDFSAHLRERGKLQEGTFVWIGEKLGFSGLEDTSASASDQKRPSPQPADPVKK